MHLTATRNLTPIISSTVETARVSGGVLRVNDAAKAIIREQGINPQMYREINDALCLQCIRSGIVVEFQGIQANHSIAQ